MFSHFLPAPQLPTCLSQFCASSDLLIGLCSHPEVQGTFLKCKLVMSASCWQSPVRPQCFQGNVQRQAWSLRSCVVRLLIYAFSAATGPTSRCFSWPLAPALSPLSFPNTCSSRGYQAQFFPLKDASWTTYCSTGPPLPS